MSDDGPVPIRLTLNKDGVTAPVLRAMRISTDMVRIGLHGIATADPSNTAVHEGFFTLNFEPREDPEKLRETYRAWLLAKGFQELARGLRQTLEEAFQYATADHGRGPQFPLRGNAKEGERAPVPRSAEGGGGTTAYGSRFRA
jgi:hypothetical protein